MREDAPQREHDLREVLDALRWMVKTGCRRSCGTSASTIAFPSARVTVFGVWVFLLLHPDDRHRTRPRS
jgi:hypothetical protein